MGKLLMAKSSLSPASEYLGEFDRKEILHKNHYFDNETVERLMYLYVEGACTDVSLRDEIMVWASELIRQLIKAHNLGQICPGKDDTSVYDLFQTAWLQIEGALYKYEARPHCNLCYNNLRPNDSLLVDEFWFAAEVIRKIKKCKKCNAPITEDTIYYKGKSKIFNMWCVNPNTLIMGNPGIQTISEAIQKSENTGQAVYGLEGFKPIIGSVRKRKQKTIIVKTELGYQLEGTPHHMIMKLCDDGPDWVKMKNLKVGDLVGIRYGQHVFGTKDNLSDIILEESGDWTLPVKITPDLAYIWGLYLAEGSFNDGQLFLYNVDQDVTDKLVENDLGLRFSYYRNSTANYTCSKQLCDLMRKVGFPQRTSASKKRIPTRLFGMSKTNINALLRGYADGDGHSSRHNGHVGFTSTSRFLLDQIRMLLLNVGILSKISEDKRTERKFVKKNGKTHISKLKGSWQLSLSTMDSYKFYDMIGFSISRKQEKMSALSIPKDYIYGLNKHFNALYKKYGSRGHFNKIRKHIRVGNYKIGFPSAVEALACWSAFEDDENYQFIRERIDELFRFMNKTRWLPIRSLIDSRSEVCDIEVESESHSYIANGFISHNSQIARTVGLAYIKKENRDRKNSNIFQSHLENRQIAKNHVMTRFLTEAREILKYNDSYLHLLKVIEELYEEEEKPHEGLIGKLVERSKLPRTTVTGFLWMMRLRSKDFSDSPINEEHDTLKDRMDKKEKEFE